MSLQLINWDGFTDFIVTLADTAQDQKSWKVAQNWTELNSALKNTTITGQKNKHPPVLKRVAPANKNRISAPCTQFLL